MYIKNTFFLVIIANLTLPITGYSTTADDVVCSKCVGQSDNAITASRLRSSAVTTGKLRSGAVTTGKLRNGAVTTGKLRNGAVTTGKLRNGAVTTGKLRNGAVTTGKLSTTLLDTISQLQSDIVALQATVSSQQTPVSVSITNYRSYSLYNSTFREIANLSLNNGDDGDHRINVPFSGKILVSTQIAIDNSGGVAVRGACKLSILNESGESNSMGRPATWYTTDNAAYDLAVPLLGAYSVSPGIYDISVSCTKLAAGGATSAALDNMWVIAVPDNAVAP